jgi:hypothetical protein
MLQHTLNFPLILITRTYKFIRSRVTTLNFVPEYSRLVRLPYVTFRHSLFKPSSFLRVSGWRWLIYRYVLISSDKTILIFLWEGFHIYLSKSKHQFIIIIIMNVVGLGLWVLSYVTYSLSDVPVLSIFLDGLCPLFQWVETVVLVLVSVCFPLYLRVEANFFGSFWSHPLYFPSSRLVSPRRGIRKRICAASSCFGSYTLKKKPAGNRWQLA